MDTAKAKDEAKAGTLGRMIPSLPFIVAIDAAIGVPQAGDKLTRAQIARAAGLIVGSSAFSNVLSKWRDQLFARHGVVLLPDYKGGFTVADDSEKIQLAGRYRNRAFNYANRCVAVAVSADSGKLSASDVAAKVMLCDTLNKAKLLLAAGVSPKS